jgi:hypothetical protein
MQCVRSRRFLNGRGGIRLDKSENRVSHYLQAVALPLMIAAVLAVAFSTRAASSVHHDVAEEAAVFGRLATVEPALRRFTLVPDGQSEAISFVLDEEGMIWQESRELSLPALLTQVGSRVKVRYHIENGVRLTRMITVAALAR